MLLLLLLLLLLLPLLLTTATTLLPLLLLLQLLLLLFHSNRRRSLTLASGMWQCIAPVLREHNTTWASSATNSCKLATYSSFKRSCSRARHHSALEYKQGDSSYASRKDNVHIQQLSTISSAMWYGLRQRLHYVQQRCCMYKWP